MVRFFSLLYLKIGLKGHSQLWDRADLDTSFASLNERLSQPEIKCTRRIHLEIRSLLPTVLFDPRSFTENLFFYSFFYNILSYLVKNSIERNMNTRRRRAGGIAFVYQNNKRNESITLASK